MTTCPVAIPTRAASSSCQPPGQRDRRHVGSGSQPGANRLLRLILRRRRPAEIGDHAIAQEVGDMPAMAGDRGHGRRLVVAHHLAHVLGIDAATEPGGIDQIAKPDHQLAALRVTRRRPGRRCRIVDRGVRPECSDRRQDDLARPHRQAELLEIGLGQMAEGAELDLVLDEHVAVALEPEPGQPLPDVSHAFASTRLFGFLLGRFQPEPNSCAECPRSQNRATPADPPREDPARGDRETKSPLVLSTHDENDYQQVVQNCIAAATRGKMRHSKRSSAQ